MDGSRQDAERALAVYLRPDAQTPQFAAASSFKLSRLPATHDNTSGTGTFDRSIDVWRSVNESTPVSSPEELLSGFTMSGSSDQWGGSEIHWGTAIYQHNQGEVRSI